MKEKLSKEGNKQESEAITPLSSENLKKALIIVKAINKVKGIKQSNNPYNLPQLPKEKQPH